MPPFIRRLSLVLTASALLATSWCATSWAASSPTAAMVHGGLDWPVQIRFAPDGRLFYLELTTGRVMTFPAGSGSSPSEWARVPVDANGERGLLGLAFHPDFPDSPYVYLYHTNPSPLFNRIVRLRDSKGVGVDYQVLRDSIPVATFHNGGRLAFGPDGMLYVGFGDLEDPAAARVNGDIRGKILRLTPLGQPAHNFYGVNDPAYARGIREVFGICFDSITGRGYFTHNGPECDDTVDQLFQGADYGWGPNDPCGGDGPGTTVAPLARFTPTIAPTGCCFYRNGPDGGWDGSLFFGTFNDGDVRRVAFDPLTNDVTQVETVVQVFDSVLDVTQGPDGRLYVSTFDAIYRVTTDPLAVPPSPAESRLAAWPNPSTGAIWLRPAHAERGAAIDVLDTTGRRLRTLVTTGGVATWDGRDDRGARVPAGVYLARVREGSEVHTVRLVKLSD